MKFDYATTPETRDPVAYIDSDGDLVVPYFGAKGTEYKKCSAAGLRGDGVEAYSDLHWEPSNPENKRLFYPGDTLTITF